MKLTKNLRLPSGTVIPAGTELHFSNEGVGYFCREEVKFASIPTNAIDAYDASLECIIVGNIFKGDYILAKHRDRTYVPKISIQHEILDGVEVAYLYDEDTGWAEGINQHRICITNSALAIGFDEHEKIISKETGRKSKDGKIILKALSAKKIDDAVQILTTYYGGVRGHTIVTDGKQFVTIESTRKHDNVITTKAGDKPIVRTNHGYEYMDAGYTKGAPFLSSVLRRQQVLDALQEANEEDNDILELMSRSKYKKHNGNNTVRDTKKMLTTSQHVMNATKRSIELRPIQGKSEFLGYINKLPKDYKAKITVIVPEVVAQTEPTE